MSRRSDSIRFKIMPNGDIRAFQSDTFDKRGVSEWMLTNPKNPSPTLTTGTDIKIFIKQDTTMKERDFHRQCRVVYRAMRKRYGVEKVQDECLRVFKVVFPLLHKAKTTEEFGFTEEAKMRIRNIFSDWHVEEGGELDLLLGKISDGLDSDFSRAGFVHFCEDILVVVMRIRKLTPRECGRLMDVSEKDLDIMLNCGVSRSALYKLFGNSIVEACLFHIFRKLFIETEPDVVKGEAVQLTLF